MKRTMWTAGVLLAALSGTAAAYSDVGVSFSIGVPGAVYSAAPVYDGYRERYYVPPRVHRYGPSWDRRAYREYREHRRHWEREHWRRDWDRRRW